MNVSINCRIKRSQCSQGNNKNKYYVHIVQTAKQIGHPATSLRVRSVRRYKITLYSAIAISFIALNNQRHVKCQRLLLQRRHYGR